MQNPCNKRRNVCIKLTVRCRVYRTLSRRLYSMLLQPQLVFGNDETTAFSFSCQDWLRSRDH